MGSHRAHRSAVALLAPRTLLVTGAGPIGLIAAMIGVQRGLEVNVVDHEDHQQKRDWCASLGAAYHAGGLDKLERPSSPTF